MFRTVARKIIASKKSKGLIGDSSTWLQQQQQRDLKTLTLNAGSTTLKYALYDVVEPSSDQEVGLSDNVKCQRLASGMVDRVGKQDASITHNGRLVTLLELSSEAVSNNTTSIPILTPMDAMKHVVQILQKDTKCGLGSQQQGNSSTIDCVGHRVVHGGSLYTQPTIISDKVMTDIDQLSALAPLHNPPALAGIQASRAQFPNATQVAIFDTAFHTASLPPSSYRYALPNDWYEQHEVRRYGFHGTSYEYVLEETAKYLQRPKQSLNCIILHLGGGASMCCIQKGKSIDTTMGFTPLEGLVMSTRSGDIDPGILDYMMKNNETKSSWDGIYKDLNKQSGLLGLSGGLSGDMRIIKEEALKGNYNCHLARQVYAERCRKYLGSYYVKLHGKVDAIVFCGGIGEGDTSMRELILEGLEEELQISIDSTRNDIATKGVTKDKQIMKIHTPFSKTKVLVVPTDEEVSIALQSSKVTLSQQRATKQSIEQDKRKAATTEPSQTSATTGGGGLMKKVIKSNLFCHSLGGTYTTPDELGLLSVMAASGDHVGYFRPIAHFGSRDYRIQLMKEHFGLPEEELELMYGVDEAEAFELMTSNKEDELVERIIEKYLAYAAKKDFVLVSTFTKTDDALHNSAKLCSALNIPAVILGDVNHDTQFGVASNAFQQHGATCLGAIVSDVEDVESETNKLQQMNIKPVALLPKSTILNKRTVGEAMKVLKDSVCLYGHTYLDTVMDRMRIYTVQVDDLVNLISENELAICNHNRVDSLMALLLAAQSSNAPTPAGLLFTLCQTGDLNPKIASLLDGLNDIRIPIVATSMDTMDAANLLDRTPMFLHADSKHKVNEAETRMETCLDLSTLQSVIANVNDDETASSKTTPRDIGPRLFQYSTFLKARQIQKTIVLPEGADPRVVEAASILSQRQLCKVILVGDPQVIYANAEKRRVSLDNGCITIVDPQNYDGLQEMIDTFVEARKKKGLTEMEAKRYLLEDVNYFGTLMMALGKADGMVSGAMHSSANTIRPALQILKTAPGASLVSSVFFMLLEDGVKVFGDCAINTSPNSEELAEIAISSAKTAQQFGIEQPRVALLSYATGESNKGELIDKVRKATQLAKEAVTSEHHGNFIDPMWISGPLQFDAAVDPAVAAVKAKEDPVAGKANVLIFPDLNAGNNGYKAVQQASKTIAVGPILQGLKKPVNDLSRGATVDDIVNTAVLTALQAVDNV